LTSDLENGISAFFLPGVLLDAAASQSAEQQPFAENDDLPVLSGLQHECVSEWPSKQPQKPPKATAVTARIKIRDVTHFTIFYGKNDPGKCLCQEQRSSAAAQPRSKCSVGAVEPLDQAALQRTCRLFVECSGIRKNDVLVSYHIAEGPVFKGMPSPRLCLKVRQ
jgi:hypothetical protein